ncbi:MULTISPECIES: hypothetical protein [Pandoraea]|uniref:Uncharacterized protein n=1 Tax=Pandoraea apista TaxID=93218 RepID=A0ABX9ZM38_9BURK|nr:MULTISPECIES: hypothetical protein [Pandoraea]MBN9094648.1 hypothetical protein [Pandoraea pnomenusa]RRJ28831.1 hypothetical protein EIB05_17890 [Pandoraea apista]RRJ73759.1 hypothetical protein EIL82_18920 [Pandoraea apista]RSD07639.1 hypothetical protein EJB12_17710 [Pandoraea apista]RSD12461.1 hypothetical protein EIZ52_20240 [Pandoraea apista]
MTGTNAVRENGILSQDFAAFYSTFLPQESCHETCLNTIQRADPVTWPRHGDSRIDDGGERCRGNCDERAAELRRGPENQQECGKTITVRHRRVVATDGGCAHTIHYRERK